MFHPIMHFQWKSNSLLLFARWHSTSLGGGMCSTECSLARVIFVIFSFGQMHSQLIITPDYIGFHVSRPQIHSKGRLSPSNQGDIPRTSPSPSLSHSPFRLPSPLPHLILPFTPLHSPPAAKRSPWNQLGSLGPQPTSILVYSEREKLIWQQLILYGFLYTEIF